LLETRQAVPDFLTQYIPEGFQDGQGDITQLKFEADEEEGADAGGWGAPAAATPAAPAADAWGAEAPAAAAPGW
jgi:hypothetical protein